jgi:hypothetical protein
LLATTSALSAHADAALCEYVIQSEWNSGFVAVIRITNTSTTSLSNWQVNWAYTDGSVRTQGWNATVTGGNPYTASDVGWNKTINPGQRIEFGVQGTKPSGPAQKPIVTGNVCDGTSSSGVSSSQIYSQPASSSRSSSSAYVPLSSLASSAQHSNLASSSRSPASLASSSPWPSSSSVSSIVPTAPIADAIVTEHGMTVHVNGRDSYDSDGDALTHTIAIRKATGELVAQFVYPEVWYTLPEPNDYFIDYSVTDGTSTATQSINFTATETPGNKAPVARMTADFSFNRIQAVGRNSYDPEGAVLTYEWDTENGVISYYPYTNVRQCNSGLPDQRVTLTVSDGELKNTVQRMLGDENCEGANGAVPVADFTYTVEGNTVHFDASQSVDDLEFLWFLGDGSRVKTGMFLSHTYAAPGHYDVQLRVNGSDVFSDTRYETIAVGGASSSSTSSSSSSSSSTTSYALASSSFATTSSFSNLHYAVRAIEAPVIDGRIDSIWDSAHWVPMNVMWHANINNPYALPASDYSGRYKALWDAEYVYLLFNISDDILYDVARDPLATRWEYDALQIFIDEDKSGGLSAGNNNAWSYYISPNGYIVDYNSTNSRLVNDHLDVTRVTDKGNHLWEMRIRIYGDDYDFDSPSNIPRVLTAGKLMGFSVGYSDNDGTSQAKTVYGSVSTSGHRTDLGWRDASVLGSLLLVE